MIFPPYNFFPPLFFAFAGGMLKGLCIQMLSLLMITYLYGMKTLGWNTLMQRSESLELTILLNFLLFRQCIS